MITAAIWLAFFGAVLLLALLADEARNAARYDWLYVLAFLSLLAAEIIATVAVNRQ